MSQPLHPDRIHITYHHGGRTTRLETRAGETLLSALRTAGVAFNGDCGGKGTCGKCRIHLDRGDGAPNERELRVLDGLVEKGWRLACQVAVHEDLEVTVPDIRSAQVSTDGIVPPVVLDPVIVRGKACVPPPSLEDQSPDDERFTEVTDLSLPYRFLATLPASLRDSAYCPSYLYRTDRGEVVRFVDEDVDLAERPLLGVAVDVGTTTLAVYLYDLESGRRIGTASALNPQKAYGADVISRIEYASESQDKLANLQRILTDRIGELAVGLAEKHGFERADLLTYTLAGNTTMMHLLAGLPPKAIAVAPFIPVTTSARTVWADELGIAAGEGALCVLLPCVAAYVGADIVAGILATGLERRTGAPALLVDIGTNGEIVLATDHGMIACSTAAGPAFEGANLLFGMGGVEGAIDHVRIADGDLAFTTIGRAPAVGLCGSGIVDIMAFLLDTAVVDETGRITDEPEDLPDALASRIIVHNGQAAFRVTEPTESIPTGILLTQRDVRELQNAKAAVRAGIEILIETAGTTADGISDLFVAGGFGNYLDIASAFRIGLFPPELQGRTRMAGNTSGLGAVMCLLDGKLLKAASDAVTKVEYVELSSDKRFTDHFVEAMMFPET